MSLLNFESFNNKLDEFLNDLITTFSEIKDFRTLKTSIVFAKSINIKLPQQIFNDFVVAKYGDQIRDRNEQFFLNHDYSEVVSSFAMTGIDSASLDIIGKLKSIWQELSDCNKDVIWKYLSVLLVLNNRCL